MRRKRTGHGGAALPAALIALAVSSALAAGLANLSRTELMIARDRQRMAVALAAADACLATVTASLPAGWDLDTVLAGPDGVSATADDGVLAAPAGCRAMARPAPGPAAPPRVQVSIDATAGAGHRIVDAVLGRATDPIPSLLWLASADRIGAVSGTLALDGSDPADPARPGWAALGAPGRPETLDAWLGAQAGGVVTSGGTVPPITAPVPPLVALAGRIRSAGAGGPETLAAAPPAAPALALVAGDLIVGAPQWGAGLLYVDGVVDVRSSFAFAGVLVATGGIRVASGATLDVAGAVWLGAAAGDTLSVAGTMAVRRDQASIAQADGLLTLPRAAALVGVRDPG